MKQKKVCIKLNNMALIDKETIRAEIERRYDDNLKAADQFPSASHSRALFSSAAKEDFDILSFLDTLPEQPTQEKEERLDSKKYVRQIVGNEVRYYEIVGKKNQIPTIAEIPSWSYRQTNGLENIIIDLE